ncbi:MAG TPA: LptF/LptG family permease [Armatimonadota bacterium]|nr:LptF/LptG family permease [Armatimonadota bacterium]
MRLLDRHILAELIGPFLFGVAAFTSLMFAGKELFKLTELLTECRVPLVTAAELMALHIPSLVVVTLPMAMLLAALLAFGRLSGDSEVVALFACGVSLYRVVLPVIALSVVVTALSFVLNEIVVPQTNSMHERIFQELKDEPPPTAKPFLVVDADNGTTNSVIYVQEGFDPSTQTMRDVWVVQYWNNKPAMFVYGREATWKAGTEWSFRDGYEKIIGEKGIGNGQTVTVSFRESRTVKIGKTPDQLALYQKKHDELSFSQLREYIRMLQSQGAEVNEYRVRLYEKISLPLASLVFALIGTPLGLRPHRSSSAMGLGLAIVIIFAYWVFMHYMTILGNTGAMSPAAASFIPTLAGACVGIALIARAAK